jgi:hypothetical protein
MWRTAATTSVTSAQAYVILGLVILGILAAGVVVIVGRKTLPSDATRQRASTIPSEPASLIRSWIAIALVIGLLIFCGAAFLVDNETLRSTLTGGLVASVGAAVAFYFSSKSADQARTDILGTAVRLAQGGAPPTAFSKASPPDWPAGEAYVYRFSADGQPPPTYEIHTGEKPPGLTLDPDGVFHGTPTEPGTYTFSVAARNSAASINTGNLEVTITEPR